MVKFMKKILILAICIFLLLNFKEDKIITAFNENEEYSFYILEFLNKNISTNNFDKYFSNLNVIWIEPYINELYADRIKKRYQFDNLNKFKSKYLEILIDNGYRNEAVNLKLEGIKIKKIKLYASNKIVENLKIENMIIKITK